jgi:tetratricopeptide (TPR) repeat protein
MRFTLLTRLILSQVIAVAAASAFLVSTSAHGQDTAAAAPEAGDPQPLLEKGEAAIKSGDFAGAIAAFNDAGKAADEAMRTGPVEDQLKMQSLQLLAIVGRGRAQAGLKEYESAERDFRSVLQNDPNYGPALIALGQMKLGIGSGESVEDALDSFQKVLSAESGNIDALFGYGKALVLLGRADEAIAPLTRVLAADPNNAEAYRLRGAGYASTYKTKQALDDLQKSIELNPDDHEAYFSLGVVYMRLEDYKNAVEQFGKAIEHYKPEPGAEEQPFLQGYLTLASAYIELGKKSTDPAAQKAAYQAAYDEAQKVVQQLEPKNPLHAKALAAALYSRGIAERMLGQLGAAIRTLTHAIELRSTTAPDDSTGPFLSEAYFRRGICFHLIGEDKMAIADFEAAAHLVQGDPRANLWEGFTYAKLGDYHQALRAYGDAIAASDRYTYAYYNRGLVYMRLGDYEKAIADFNEAIRLEPTNAEYYFKRGLAYEQLREYQRAAESYATAIEFNNQHEGAHRHMAEVQQRLGRSELSTQYRQKAQQLAPQKKPQ